MISFTEENYLKALLRISFDSGETGVGTNELASHLGVKPATANDMLKRLRDKALVDFEKYKKITLTIAGKKIATEVIRKHRLWETFLYEKLEFSWDEVHDVAEQLEHIQSSKLIDKLEKFLDYPAFDPLRAPPAFSARQGQTPRQVPRNPGRTKDQDWQASAGRTSSVLPCRRRSAPAPTYCN